MSCFELFPVVFLILYVSEGPGEEKNRSIWHIWHIDYVQYSNIKSHWRTALTYKWKTPGNWKEFPTWNRSCLKIGCAWNIHSLFGGRSWRGMFLLLCYLSLLCGESYDMLDTQALILHIPASIAQGTEIAFIESHNDLTSLARLCEMCLASQWLHRAITEPANRTAACPRNGLATGEDNMFPEQIGTLGCCTGVLFSRPETVSEDSWGFPKLHSSGGQASSDVISEWWGTEWGSRTRRSKGSVSTITGNQWASVRELRKTARTFWHSAWHMVGIQQGAAELNTWGLKAWTPHSGIQLMGKRRL